MAVCLFALSSCADFFQGKVDMNPERDSSSGLFELLTKPEEITALEAPSELHISQGLYAGTITVSWSEVKYATSYQLERAVVEKPSADGTWKLPDETDFSVLSSFVYGTSYSDTVLSQPDYLSPEYSWRYYYRVTAQNLIKGYDSSPFYPDYEVHKETDADGNVTNEYVNADPAVYGCLFGAPVQVEADKGKSTDVISVKWQPVAGAAKYQIYRGEKDTGTDSVFIDSVFANETSYENKMLASEQGVEFYYKIYAENANGNLSAASSLAMGYSLEEGAPTAPDTVSVDNGLGTSKSVIKITWSEVVSADTITYSLYRTSSADSSYKLLKKDLEDTEFEDTTAGNGLYYYYFVRTSATDADGNTLNSAFSDSGKDSENPAYGFLLSPPSSVEVSDSEKGEGFVKIRWKPAINVLDEKNQIDYSYNICSDSSVDGYFGTIAVSETKGELDSDGYLFCDVERKAGIDYFAVTTVNAAGVDKESKKSTVVAPVPPAPTDVYATKTVGLTEARKRVEAKGGTLSEAVWQANKLEVYPVLVTWSAVESAAGYDVYRSTKPDSGFRKVNEAAPLTDCYYVDAYNASKSGTLYYYKVISLNTLGQGTKSNNPADDAAHNARGYGALTAAQWFREYDKNITSSQAKLTLMHKPNNLDKVGSETIKGDISGTLGYTAAVQGLGARITMPYTNYADFYISGTKEPMFVLNGNTNTTSNMSANGKMDGTVECKGMYPGSVVYNNVEVKGGAAGGGYYLVTTKDLADNVVISDGSVNWIVGDEQ